MLAAAVVSYAAQASYIALCTMNNAREATVGGVPVALIAVRTASFHCTAAFAVPSLRLFASAGKEQINIAAVIR